jgi:hypothetical protein
MGRLSTGPVCYVVASTCGLLSGALRPDGRQPLISNSDCRARWVLPGKRPRAVQKRPRTGMRHGSISPRTWARAGLCGRPGDSSSVDRTRPAIQTIAVRVLRKPTEAGLSRLGADSAEYLKGWPAAACADVGGSSPSLRSDSTGSLDLRVLLSARDQSGRMPIRARTVAVRNGLVYLATGSLVCFVARLTNQLLVTYSRPTRNDNIWLSGAKMASPKLKFDAEI